MPLKIWSMGESWNRHLRCCFQYAQVLNPSRWMHEFSVQRAPRARRLRTRRRAAHCPQIIINPSEWQSANCLWLILHLNDFDEWFHIYSHNVWMHARTWRRQSILNMPHHAVHYTPRLSFRFAVMPFCRRRVVAKRDNLSKQANKLCTTGKYWDWCVRAAANSKVYMIVKTLTKSSWRAFLLSCALRLSRSGS